MSQRENKLLWLRDVLNNLRSCHKQLEWTQNTQTIQVITETMLRDLECCRRLCATLQQAATKQEAA
jgi:hypothetical protein